MTVDEHQPRQFAPTPPVESLSVSHYDKPTLTAKGKKEVRRLGKTPFGSLEVQVANGGGENRLHSHKGNDGFWFVLKGGARFYTDNDVLVAEIHENEGFVTPRGYRYWFESIEGPEDLELLHFAATTARQIPTQGDDRTFYPPRGVARHHGEDTMPMSEEVGQKTEGFSFHYEPSKAKSQQLGATDRGVIGIEFLPGGSTKKTDLDETDQIAFVKTGRIRVRDDTGTVSELGESDVLLLPANSSVEIDAIGGADVELVRFYAGHDELTTRFRPFN